MPNIVIREDDQTTIQDGGITTDIAFIPGFANTNRNVYVYNSFNDEPINDELGQGTPGGSPVTDNTVSLCTFQKQYSYDSETGKPVEQPDIVSPQFAVNNISKKVWVYTASASLGDFVLGTDSIGVGASAWREVLDGSWKTSLLAGLLPENTPVLVETIQDFKKYFGKSSYTFTENQLILGNTDGTIPDDAKDCPTIVVDPKATPSGAGKTDIMYKVGDSDKSYEMAYDYLMRGLQVMYYNVSERKKEGVSKGQKEQPNILAIYNELAGTADFDDNAQTPGMLDEIKDKNMYGVKYVTSGGYPTFELLGYVKKGSGSTYTIEDGNYSKATDNLRDVSVSRGDCVTIIDHFDNIIRPLTGEDSLVECAKNGLGDNAIGTYSTMFTPWATYTVNGKTLSMPGSYAYLHALASSIQSYPNYLAVAGTARGQLPNLIKINSIYSLTHSMIDSYYQPRDGVAINPITMVTPYGWTIWGNRTLNANSEGNLTASSFLNIRNMVSDIKKQAYITAKRLMFEQDSDTLWLRFKMGLSPLLDSMKTGNGLSDYRIIRLSTKYDGTPLNKGEVAAIIRIFPRYAIEDWEITVVISDDEVTVE